MNKILILFALCISSVFALRASEPIADEIIDAVSDATAYRSRVESIGQNIKEQYDPSSSEYQIAQSLYNNARRQNNVFITDLLATFQGATPDRNLTDAATTATITATNYVGQVGAQSFKSSKSLATVIAPFIRLLVAVLTHLHNKSGFGLLAGELSPHLMWRSWEEL